MGADLYIWPLYEPNRSKWEPLFEKAARRRDGLKGGSPEFEQAQEEVSECYERMYGQGYFRDPYNDWDLLWQFGLSWWQDVLPVLDKAGNLPVETVGRLLDQLEEREAVFEQKLSQLPPKDQEYFRQRYRKLREFLNQAIELRTPVNCSL